MGKRVIGIGSLTPEERHRLLLQLWDSLTASPEGHGGPACRTQPAAGRRGRDVGVKTLSFSEIEALIGPVLYVTSDRLRMLTGATL